MKALAWAFAAVVVGGAAGVTVAMTHHHATNNGTAATLPVTATPNSWHRGDGFGVMGKMFQDAAQALGLTSSQLLSQLKSGESLATIASQHGSSASALESTLLKDVTSVIQEAETHGQLTTSQVATLESHLKGMIDRLVTTTPGQFTSPAAGRWHGYGAAPMGHLMAEAAGALHLSAGQLESDLASGQSLSTIAAKQGVPLSQLESTLTKDLEANIQSAVNAGTLTSSQASMAESHLSSMVDRWVTGTGYRRGGGSS